MTVRATCRNCERQAVTHAGEGRESGQGTVYRQGGVVTGESSFIRERARTLGMTMRDLASVVLQT